MPSHTVPTQLTIWRPWDIIGRQVLISITSEYYVVFTSFCGHFFRPIDVSIWRNLGHQWDVPETSGLDIIIAHWRHQDTWKTFVYTFQFGQNLISFIPAYFWCPGDILGTSSCDIRFWCPEDVKIWHSDILMSDFVVSRRSLGCRFRKSVIYLDLTVSMSALCSLFISIHIGLI